MFYSIRYSIIIRGAGSPNLLYYRQQFLLDVTINLVLVVQSLGNVTWTLAGQGGCCIQNNDDVITCRLFTHYGSLCEGNPPVTGGFPSQRASNVELWCFFFVVASCWTNSLVTGDLSTMTPMWCHCNVQVTSAPWGPCDVTVICL